MTAAGPVRVLTGPGVNPGLRLNINLGFHPWADAADERPEAC